MKKEKCRFIKNCKWYNPKSPICTEEGGFYGASFPGCYRRMEIWYEENLKSKYFKLTHFSFTKKDIERALKDLEKFKKFLKEQELRLQTNITHYKLKEAK